MHEIEETSPIYYVIASHIVNLILLRNFETYEKCLYVYFKLQKMLKFSGGMRPFELPPVGQHLRVRRQLRGLRRRPCHSQPEAPGEDR